jgi:hypothetical protein
MNDCSNHDWRRELRLLISQALDGSLSREGIEQMERILESGREMRAYYREYLSVHCSLTSLTSTCSANTDDASSVQNNEFWATLADYEKTAPVIEVPQPREERPLINKVLYPPREKHPISRFSVFSFVVSVAAILLIVMFVRFAPAKRGIDVATLADSINAQWADKQGPLPNDTRLLRGDPPLLLREGLAEIVFDTNARVVIEGPAEFQILDDDRIGLRYGKMFASIPQEAIGFSVSTWNAEVIDLGTEFGVLSHINGNTEVLTFKGKVNIFAGEKHKMKTSRLLTAGSAVRVDARDSGVQDIVLDEQVLVRKIDSKSNLVWRGQDILRLDDLLLGGSGFGTALLQEVEFETATGAVLKGVKGDFRYKTAPGRYVPAAESPYLDGIFVPDGSGDPVISSAGHRFRECPETSGLYYTNVVCRKTWTFFDPLMAAFEKTRRFPDSGVLYLHSNIGMTVDLDAVREKIGELKIDAFSAFAGIVRMGGNSPKHSEVDVWVLIDGQVRAAQKGIQSDRSFEVRVEITDQDRYLTLAVTDGGTVYDDRWPANHLDTCGFAEPVFELVQR